MSSIMDWVKNTIGYSEEEEIEISEKDKLNASNKRGTMCPINGAPCVQ